MKTFQFQYNSILKEPSITTSVCLSIYMSVWPSNWGWLTKRIDWNSTAFPTKWNNNKLTRKWIRALARFEAQSMKIYYYYDYVVWQSPDINPPNINPDKCINSPGDESIKSRMEWYVIRYFHWHLPNLFLCVVVVVVVVVVWLEASRGNSRELWRHQRSIISVVLPLPASSIQPPPAISSSPPPLFLLHS